jgi:hypothetical protein
LKPVEIIHRVETKIFYFLVEIFKIETFQSRLICIEIFIKIVEINRDCLDKLRLLRLFEIYRDLLTFLRDFSKMDQK